MITCVQKDTHTKMIDRPNRIGKFVPRMSNRNTFVNCVGEKLKMLFQFGNQARNFSKIFSKYFIMSGSTYQ